MASNGSVRRQTKRRIARRIGKMFYEEDEIVVEPVKGVKYNGTRYNSEKGYYYPTIYYFQKKT
ncbi:hypothetical protein OUZ56_029545 [Daphnia magna]|uniref:Uncharacterized protein n=1 Tax=Daphnia magna TaxID=35525 RepID=A0ABR0B746_9CRUS|nr:hypothetical protein OUZ56_029545 [Daphnia magna]